MQTSTLPELSSSPWQRNDIQFPRLLAEIMAAGAIDENAWTAICQSMDLQTEELRELFDRAQTEWEQIKSNSLTADLGITPNRRAVVR